MSSSRPMEPRPIERLRGLAVLAASAVLLSLAVAACATAGPSPSIAIALDQAAVQLVRGGQVQVQLTLTREGGADADVSLSVSGVPTNVQAGLSPDVLSGDTLAATLVLSADAAATEGQHTVTVTATAGPLEAEATLDLSVVSLTVSGVVTTMTGSPLEGVDVSSQGASAVTDAEGRFTIGGLSVPYSVTVSDAAESWAHVFDGLTSSAPVITPGVTPASPAYSTTITGSLAGNGFPVAADHAVYVCVEGLDGVVSGCDTLSPGESDFALTPEWYGSATRPARLHILHVEFGPDLMPLSYPGYATVDLDLNDGTPIVFGTPLELSGPVETKTVEVDIDSPGPVSFMVAAVQFGPNLALMLTHQTTGATVYDVLVPAIPGADHYFAAGMAGLQFAWALAGEGDTVDVEIPGAPAPLAPADGATGVTTSTAFEASNPAGGALVWEWIQDPSGLRYLRTTASDPTTLPDTAAQGLPLPAGANFRAAVYAVGGEGDAAAHALRDYFSVFWVLALRSSPGLLGNGYIVIGSSNVSFTTAP